jgi:hypothetical protein
MIMQISESLAQLEREREMQMNMLESARRWLVEHGLQLESGPPLAEAVVSVLKSSAPQSLHSSDVWSRIKPLNPQTANDNPEGAVDLALLTLERTGQCERVGPRTYRWVASLDGVAAMPRKGRSENLKAAGVEGAHRLTPRTFESGILAILQAAKNPKKGLTFEEVLAAARLDGLNPRTTNLKHGVYNALNNLRRRGKVMKPKRGYFAAAKSLAETSAPVENPPATP